MPPNPGKRWRWLILVALLIAAAFLWNPTPKPPAEPNDCQQDHLVIRGLEKKTITASDLPLLGPIGDLPEFHDCQRFLIPAGAAGAVSAGSTDGLAFGPLVAIWAANRLDRAFVERRPLDGMAVPVAIVYEFDSNDYEALGIRPGFSCLYLWQDSSWHGRLVSLGADVPDAAHPTRCLEPVPTTSRALVGGTRLDVRADSLPKLLTAQDIPPVARWDWDAKNRRQFIGIRCGDAWCNVGAPGFLSSPPTAVGAAATRFLAALVPFPGVGARQATPTEVQRTVAVKGWYDDQRLDLRTGGVLSLAEAHGVVFPQPALDSVPVGAYHGAWIPSAYVVTDRAYPRPAKLPMAEGVNRIEICNGTASRCEVPEGAEHCVDKATGQAIDRNDPNAWWGRVIPESGEPYYYCVKRRTHDGQAIPVAAARWNWSELDAKTWSRCGDACCTGN